MVRVFQPQRNPNPPFAFAGFVAVPETLKTGLHGISDAPDNFLKRHLPASKQHSDSRQFFRLDSAGEPNRYRTIRRKLSAMTSTSSCLSESVLIGAMHYVHQSAAIHHHTIGNQRCHGLYLVIPQQGFDQHRLERTSMCILHEPSFLLS